MTALQRGIVNENTVLNTIPYRINGHEIKDVARYSELTLTGVLQKSSNVGVSKLALAMPSSALVETYSRFGLGKATNLGLVGERSGLYPQKQRWSDIERATFSFRLRANGDTVTVSASLTQRSAANGVYRPLSITKVDPPVPASVSSRINRPYGCSYDESVALPAGRAKGGNQRLSHRHQDRYGEKSRAGRPL